MKSIQIKRGKFWIQIEKTMNGLGCQQIILVVYPMKVFW